VLWGCRLQSDTIAPVSVRNPLPGEQLSPELLSGLAFAPHLDLDWVWLLELDEEPVACCITSPMHGALLLIRVASLPRAPRLWFLMLMRTVFEEAKSRGLKGWLTMMEASRKPEIRLARIARRHGTVRPFEGFMGWGKF
jgi:hypothetical protein